MLRFDDAWRIALAGAGDSEVLLLGTAMDLDRPAASGQEIAQSLAAALDASDAAFLDRVDALTGAHLIFARRGDETWALQDATDLSHWEQRLGRAHAELVRRSKLSHTTFVIWNNRRLLTAMLARPAEDRWKGRVAWRLVERLWPELLEVPVYSRASYVARPDDRLEGRVGELRDLGRALARRARAIG